MSASLVGLSSSDVAYAQQAATHVEITVDGVAVCAEIDVHKKELSVKFKNPDDYSLLKSSCSQTVPVCFILKHSYFKNLHSSLDRISSNMISCLIPNWLYSKQGKLPRPPYPTVECLWLDKEYQLLALKKMMACDNSAPFLLTGPFGTGKTRVLATAAITFLKRRSNRVLICTSHLQSADAYIDNYFGPIFEKNQMPYNVKPIRLIGKDYNYSGKDPYNYLVKKALNKKEIKESRLIVTTFLTAPQLINIKMKHFTHILIDEGAQTREPEAVAPLGLADDNTKIVIAGDHLQVKHL